VITPTSSNQWANSGPSGVEIDWHAFYAGEQRRRVILPTYPLERKRHWVEPTPLHNAPTSIPPPFDPVSHCQSHPS